MCNPQAGEGGRKGCGAWCESCVIRGKPWGGSPLAPTARVSGELCGGEVCGRFFSVGRADGLVIKRENVSRGRPTNDCDGHPLAGKRTWLNFVPNRSHLALGCGPQNRWVFRNNVLRSAPLPVVRYVNL